MEKEEIVFLNQLVKSLESAEIKLEESYKKNDYANFNQSKKIMMRVQEGISGIIK